MNSHFPLHLTKTNLYLTLMVLQAGKASLSANAPACVAVWGWEERAGCVQRRAPPPACGKAPDPGDWKDKRMGGSSVCRMFCFSALRRRPCLWTLQQYGQYHNRSSQTITGSVIRYQLVASRFPSLWVACMTDLMGEKHFSQQFKWTPLHCSRGSYREQLKLLNLQWNTRPVTLDVTAGDSLTFSTEENSSLSSLRMSLNWAKLAVTLALVS